MKANACFKLILLGLVMVALTGDVRAGLVYDNTATNYGALMLTNNQVVGGEIFPDNLNAFPSLTSFSFEFYSPTIGATYADPYQWLGGSSVLADVKFYLNNGPAFNGYPTPGALPFYDTGWFNLLNPLAYTGGTSNRMTLTFGPSDLYTLGNPAVAMNPAIALPTDFTVVYQFDGLTNGNMLGLSLYQPPTVGTNYGNYWVKDSFNNWELVTNISGPVAFGQQFIGDVPEPSMVGLGALGAILLGGLLKRRK